MIIDYWLVEGSELHIWALRISCICSGRGTWAARYIASFDEDFRRVRDIVKEEMGIRMAVSPDELLSLL